MKMMSVKSPRMNSRSISAVMKSRPRAGELEPANRWRPRARRPAPRRADRRATRGARPAGERSRRFAAMATSASTARSTTRASHCCDQLAHQLRVDELADALAAPCGAARWQSPPPGRVGTRVRPGAASSTAPASPRDPSPAARHAGGILRARRPEVQRGPRDPEAQSRRGLTRAAGMRGTAGVRHAARPSAGRDDVTAPRPPTAQRPPLLVAALAAQSGREHRMQAAPARRVEAGNGHRRPRAGAGHRDPPPAAGRCRRRSARRAAAAGRARSAPPRRFSAIAIRPRSDRAPPRPAR